MIKYTPSAKLAAELQRIERNLAGAHPDVKYRGVTALLQRWGVNGADYTLYTEFERCWSRVAYYSPHYRKEIPVGSIMLPERFFDSTVTK